MRYLLTIEAGNLSGTPQDPVEDVLQPDNDILSAYHTFASVVSIYIVAYDQAVEGV